MNRKLQSCFFADNCSYKSLARPVQAFKLHISSVSQQKNNKHHFALFHKRSFTTNSRTNIHMVMKRPNNAL